MRATGKPPAINVLGPVRLWRDGVGAPIRSRNQRVALALLALAQGHAVRTDVLAEALWGEAPPSDPRGAVHTVVSRLRATLGPVAEVVSVPEGYALTHPDDTDVARFEALVADATRASARDRVELLREALGLWRGEPFEDVPDVPALVPEAARLATQAQQAREGLGAALAQLDRHEEALEVLAPTTSTDPLSERSVALRMRSLYALGRQTDALEAMRAHREELADELGLDPSPALADLEVAVLNHQVPAGPSTRHRQLPSSAVWQPSSTRFVSRDRELEQLRRLSEGRCTVVTGPGGVGKTRLVAEWATNRAEDPDPLVYVGLLGVAPGDVDLAVAVALGLRTDDRDVRGAIVEYLAPEPILLVLDNCEHVLDEVRSLVTDLLRRAPRTRVVATSRSRLELPQERLLPLSPLPLPDTGDHPTTQLFLDRLSALRAGRDPDDGEVASAVAVCRRLDGLPLALELAANRAASLGVDVLASRIDDALDLLDDDIARPGPRGLRGVLDWSYRLLDETDQRLLRTLAVFEGPAAMPTIESVSDRPGTARGVAHLADLGLVATVPGTTTTYRLLDLVRRFAREQLDAAGETAAVRDAHARWAIAHARAAADAANGPEDGAVFADVARHRTDLLAALRWTLETDLSRAATLAGHLARISPFRTDVDLLAWVRRVAETPGVDSVPDGALVQAAAARAAALAGDVDWAEPMAQAAAEAADPVVRYLVHHALGIVRLYRNDPVGGLAAAEAGLVIEGLQPAHLVDFHVTAALVTAYAGNSDRSREHAVAASALADAAGAGAYRAIAAYVAGERVVQDDPSAAIPPFRRAVELAAAVDAPFVWGIASTSLASALVRVGQVEEAAHLMAGVLRHWRQARSWPQLWTAVRLTAELLGGNDDETALLLLDAAEHGQGATPVAGRDRERHGRIRERAEASLDETARLRVRALAASLTPAQVVERAIAATQSHAPA